MKLGGQRRRKVSPAGGRMRKSPSRKGLGTEMQEGEGEGAVGKELPGSERQCRGSTASKGLRAGARRTPSGHGVYFNGNRMPQKDRLSGECP